MCKYSRNFQVHAKAHTSVVCVCVCACVRVCVRACVCVYHNNVIDKMSYLQLTWVPNEIEDYDVVVFEFIDRLNEPKGWLLKLWEAVTKEGVVIFLTAVDSQWDETKIDKLIKKWYSSYLVLTSV